MGRKIQIFRIIERINQTRTLGHFEEVWDDNSTIVEVERYREKWIEWRHQWNAKLNWKEVLGTTFGGIKVRRIENWILLREDREIRIGVEINSG